MFLLCEALPESVEGVRGLAYRVDLNHVHLSGLEGLVGWCHPKAVDFHVLHTVL